MNRNAQDLLLLHVEKSIMRLNRILFVFLVLCFAGEHVVAQTEFGETQKSRIYVGGNFSLSLGNITLVEVSPLAGYNITRSLSAGIGTTYMFYSYRDQFQSYRTSFYGGRIFTRFVPLPDLLPAFFLHGEIESLSAERLLTNPITGVFELDRKFVPAYMAGIGIRQPAGKNSFFTLTLLYNFSDDGTFESTIYPSPIQLRVGYIFGLY